MCDVIDGLFAEGPFQTCEAPIQQNWQALIALAAGVKKVLWLPLLDNPTGRLGETHSGLISLSGDPRGASTAFAVALRLLRTARP